MLDRATRMVPVSMANAVGASKHDRERTADDWVRSYFHGECRDCIKAWRSRISRACNRASFRDDNSRGCIKGQILHLQLSLILNRFHGDDCRGCIKDSDRLFHRLDRRRVYTSEHCAGAMSCGLVSHYRQYLAAVCLSIPRALAMA